MGHLVVIFYFLAQFLTSVQSGSSAQKIVIAHRGASGYLPPHTLAGKALAIGQGADYIEQDLILSKDNVLVVCHDLRLDTTTNVNNVYPGRIRSDGRYYAIDFLWEEIKNLTKTSSYHYANGDHLHEIPDFPGRFPLWLSRFRMNTFEQELQMVRGLEKSTGKTIGIYPEIKDPEWHRQQGKNITSLALQMLKKYNYTSTASKCFLQCFDAAELLSIHETHFKQMQMNLPLVQLLPFRSNASYKPTLKQMSVYAHGLGPNKDMIILPNSTAANLHMTTFVTVAHALGIVVHPWTFRKDQMPTYTSDFNRLLGIFYCKANVDGVFSDFPDKAAQFLAGNGCESSENGSSKLVELHAGLSILLAFAALVKRF